MAGVSVHVGVSVQPRLYADALVRMLRGARCEVVRLAEGPEEPVIPEGCQIVIASGPDTPAPQPGAMVIRLPDTGRVEGASIITVDAEETVDFDHVQQLIELVAEYCRKGDVP